MFCHNILCQKFIQIAMAISYCGNVSMWINSLESVKGSSYPTLWFDDLTFFGDIIYSYALEEGLPLV